MKTFNKAISLFALLLIPFFAANAFNGISTTPSDDNVRTIEMTGNDRMKFSVTEINAEPGEKIRIVLTTVSKMPKMAMAHNVVVLEEDTDVEAFANASAMARDNDYIAPDMEDQIIAATTMAGGGETVEITFTVPQDAGSYSYICSFPGHFFGGMKGTLNVKKTAS